MPHQLGVQERVAVLQRVRFAPEEKVRFALEAHHVRRDPPFRSGSPELHTQALDTREQAEGRSTFLAAGRGHRGSPPTLSETPP